jgi:hypothetical protein
MQWSVEAVADLKIEKFYDENPARRGSEELEFGADWSGEDGTGELGWIRDTGELYLMLGSGAVDVLAVLDDQDDVEALLRGWEVAMPRRNSVQWVRDRVVEWFEGAVHRLPLDPDPRTVQSESDAVPPDADASEPSPDAYEPSADWGPLHRLGWLRPHLDDVAREYAVCRATLDPGPAFERALADGLDEDSYEQLQAYFDGDHDRFYGDGAGAEAHEQLGATLEQHYAASR